MAVKQFAIPLDVSSVQTGDITFKGLVDNAKPVTFRLSNVSSGSTNELNLITNKSGTTKDHKFGATVFNGNASVELTAPHVEAIYRDADSIDWDYIQAYWTVGAVDTPGSSNNFEIQVGNVYDTNGWPPK